jgi:hypothetical protein
MAFSSDSETEELLVESRLRGRDEYGLTAHDLAWQLGLRNRDGRTVLPALRRLERKKRVQKLWYDSYHQGWRWSVATPAAIADTGTPNNVVRLR